MLHASLAGDVGVSVHDGRMTRLWEASSGRRLGCFQHRGKHALTCCDAGGGLAVVGDAAGAVHVFELDADDFAPARTLVPSHATELGEPAQPAAAALPSAAACSVLLLHEHRPAATAATAATAGPPPPPPRLCLVARASGEVCAHAMGTGLPPLWEEALPEHIGPIALASAGAAGVGSSSFFAVSAMCASRVDVERVVATWQVSLPGHTAAEGVLPLAAGSRAASYSPGWGLLAVAESSGTVALWDPRLGGGGLAAAAGRLHLPGGDLAESVYLDHGEGTAWPGALLVSARHAGDGGGGGGGGGGSVRLFDIRKLADGGACGSASEPLSLTGCPQLGSRRDKGSGGGTCFVADATRVIYGAGARSSSVAMWSLAGGASGLGEENLSEAGATAGSASEPTPRSRQRKPRGTKKEWSH